MAFCDVPIVDLACELTGEVSSSIAGSFFESVAEAFASAFGGVIHVMTTFWIEIPTPNIGAADGPVAALREGLGWLVGAVGVLSVLIAAGKLAVTRNGEPAADAVKGIVQFVFLAWGGVAAISLLTSFGDQYSSWIINRASDGDIGRALSEFTGIHELDTLGAALMLIVGIIGILSGLAQTCLMFVRSGMLVILAGTLPLAAAAGISGGGRQTRDKFIAWTIAFILYKPVAATVYAGAFLTVSRADNVMTKLSGIFMIILAVAALPAVMRVVTPAISTISSGGGGGSALGAAAGSALASGAIRSAGSKTSGASQPSSGGNSPSGNGPGGATRPSGSQGHGGQGPGQSGTSGSGSTPSGPTGPSSGGSGGRGVPQGGAGLTNSGSGTSGSASQPTGTSGASGAASTTGASGAGGGTGAASAGGGAVAGPTGAAVAAGVESLQQGRSAAQRAADGGTGNDPTGAQGGRT